jgi:hypothetical protein
MVTQPGAGPHIATSQGKHRCVKSRIVISKKVQTNCQHRRRIVFRVGPCRLLALVVRVVAVIVAALATVNSASAPAGTWPSIQTRTNARIAAERADAPPVATPESSRLDFLILDRRGVRSRAVSLAEMRSPSATDGASSESSPLNAAASPPLRRSGGLSTTKRKPHRRSRDGS